MNRSWFVFLTLAVTCGAVGCGKSLECGEGTTEQDGECVAKGSPDNSATNNSGTNNSGTNNSTQSNNANAGTEVTCGPGTELDDDDRCVVVDPTTCGAGTMLDANSGECVVTDAVCGANTAYDSDSDTCLPTSMVCASGTTFDEAMGICMPDAQCQPGDVIVDGFCLSPVEELLASATLQEAENNDPALDGTADTLTLPANVGEQVVMAGGIAAPADIDGDGEPDQDLDVIEFDATAGQWLMISVQPTGGPPLSFNVTGPDGYERFNLANADYGAARQLVTSRDGTFQITVGPHDLVDAFAPPGEPGLVGDDDAEWVLAVEILDPPAPRTVDFGAGATGVVPGDDAMNLLSSDGFTANALVSFDADFPGSAEIISFDGDTVIGATTASSGPLVVPSSGTVTIAFDWIDTDRGAEYTITATEVGVPTDLGTIASGGDVTGTIASLDDDPQYFTFELPAGHVAEFSQTNDELEFVDLDVLDGGGTSVGGGFLASLGEGSTNYAYAGQDLDGGTFLVEVDAFSTRTNLELTITAVEPTDLGMLSDGSTVSEADPSMFLRGKRLFFTGDFTMDSLVSGTAEAGGADVDLRLLADDGSTFLSAGSQGGESFNWIVPTGEYLFELRAFAELTTGYTLDFDVTEYNPVVEMEPNDDAANANDIALDDLVEGSSMEMDEDWFAFSVTTAGIYTATVAPAMDTFFIISSIDFVNQAGEVVATGQTGIDDFVTGFLEPGDYYVRIIGDEPMAKTYLLTMSMDATGADLDDPGNNETSTDATAAALAAGYSIAGGLNGSADEDWYVFDLAAATSYRVADTGGTVAFFDDALAPITPTSGIVDLPAGTSYMSVTGFTDGGQNDYLVNFAIPPANSVSSSPALAIPDGGAPMMNVATDTIDVMGGPCALSAIEVPIDISHTWRGDLIIDLESPAGTTVRLYDGDDFDGTDDLIGIFGSSIQTEEALDAFLGEDVRGTWTLTVGDIVTPDSGTLNSWGLDYGCQ